MHKYVYAYRYICTRHALTFYSFWLHTLAPHQGQIPGSNWSPVGGDCKVDTRSRQGVVGCFCVTP